MIPIQEWPPTGDSAPFERQLSGRVAGAASFDRPTFHPLGAVGMMMRNASADARQKLADALYYIELAPQPALTAALNEELKKFNIPLENLYQIAIAETVRNDDVSRVPTHLDAVLDVQIYGAGYFPAGGTRGYSPMFYATARLLSTRASGPVIEEYAYASDYRNADGDTRFFTTAAELSAQSYEDIKERAPILKRGMLEVIRTVAASIATDVHRTSRAEVRRP